MKSDGRGLGSKRKLQAELQDLKVTSTASHAKHSELQEAVKAYRAKAEDYLSRLEQAEIEKVKAANGESFGMRFKYVHQTSPELPSSSAARKALDDLEKAHVQALKERKSAEERASKAEQGLREISARVERGDRQSSDLEAVRERLEEELQEERDRHTADLAERDFAMNQTQITYQSKRSIFVFYCIATLKNTHAPTAKLAELSDGGYSLISPDTGG